LFYKTVHFELAYAHEYIGRGYKSAFLDTISCIHIGKKTWENTNETKNAYKLNNVDQFEKTDESLSVIVISLDSGNLDNWKKFKERARGKLEHYSHSQNATDNTIDLHLYNDMSISGDMVKYIDTHRKVWKDMQTNYCLIMDDGIIFNEDFWEKLGMLGDNNIDIIQLSDNIFSCYVIKKDFAKKLLSVNSSLLVSRKFPPCVLKKCICVTSTKKFTKNPIFDGYKFYRGMDTYGNDIRWAGYMSPEELKKLCDNDESCVGFNTIGWMKMKIGPITKLYNARNLDDGLYVKIKT